MPLNIKPCHLRAARTMWAGITGTASHPWAVNLPWPAMMGTVCAASLSVAGPVARYLDDGLTLEILRCCTDGTDNACSKLTGACCHIGFDMGCDRIVTYTAGVGNWGIFADLWLCL